VKLRALVTLGALPLAAALLVGCSSSAGPLGQHFDQGQQCIPGTQGRTVTMGFFEVHNHGSSTVKLTGITLPKVHGMVMTKTWLTPILVTPGHDELIGLAYPYPPHSVEWPKRVPAIGAVLKPGQDLNLVFGLTMTSPHNASSDPPQITYTAGGNGYTVNYGTTILMGNCSGA
jgi:hypothetical protein